MQIKVKKCVFSVCLKPQQWMKVNTFLFLAKKLKVRRQRATYNVHTVVPQWNTVTHCSSFNYFRNVRFLVGEV